MRVKTAVHFWRAQKVLPWTNIFSSAGIWVYLGEENKVITTTEQMFSLLQGFVELGGE